MCDMCEKGDALLNKVMSRMLAERKIGESYVMGGRKVGNYVKGGDYYDQPCFCGKGGVEYIGYHETDIQYAERYMLAMAEQCMKMVNGIWVMGESFMPKGWLGIVYEPLFNIEIDEPLYFFALHHGKLYMIRTEWSAPETYWLEGVTELNREHHTAE